MANIVFKQYHPIIRKWAVPEIFGEGKVSEVIRTQSRFATKIIKTPLLCTHPMFAFTFRTKYEKCPSLNVKRSYLDLNDGGLLGIDKIWSADTLTHKSDKPIVLMFPGGNEHTYSTKIQTLCYSYLKAGYSEVFLCNYRGKCNTPLKTAQFSMPYGRFNDLPEIINFINNKYNNHDILLTGDCFGGQFVADYLKSDSISTQKSVIGGVVHSVHWNTELSNELIQKEPNFSLFVKPSMKMTRDLLVNGKKGSENIPEMVRDKIGQDNFDAIKSLSMETLDDLKVLYECCLNGLYEIKDEEDYVAKTSPNRNLQQFHKPFVLINAYDDPTVCYSSEDLKNIESDPNMCLWLFASGGHCSYVKSMFPVCNFIDDVMVECSNTLVLSMK